MSSSIKRYTPQSWNKQLTWGENYALTQRSIYEFLVRLTQDCVQITEHIELECRLNFKQNQEHIFFILLNLMQRPNHKCELEYSLSEEYCTISQHKFDERITPRLF